MARHRAASGCWGAATSAARWSAWSPSRPTRSPPAPASGSRSPPSPCAASPRSAPSRLPASLLTTDAAAVVEDPTIDVVVEVIGGIEPARTLVLDALSRKKPVVTGNKELLANHGAELFAAADAAGVDLLFEAAVAGGIPFIRRCASRWWASGSAGCWASSTAPPTSSSPA